MKPLNLTFLALILACGAAPFAAVADEMTTSLVDQLGNTAVTIQMGSANMSAILQDGHGNLAAVFQSGTGLVGGVTQSGNYQGYGSTQVNGKPYGGAFQAIGGNGFSSAMVVIQAN